MPLFPHATEQLVCKEPRQRGSSGSTFIQPSPNGPTEMYRRTLPPLTSQRGFDFIVLCHNFYRFQWQGLNRDYRSRVPGKHDLWHTLQPAHSCFFTRWLGRMYQKNNLATRLGIAGIAFLLSFQLQMVVFCKIAIPLGDYYALDIWEGIHLC